MKTWRSPLDPSDKKPYVFDWNTLLTAEADTITGVPVITLPQSAIDAGLEVSGQTNTTLIVTVSFNIKTANQNDKGFNVPGSQFEIACKIVTAGGRTFEKSGILTVCHQ